MKSPRPVIGGGLSRIMVGHIDRRFLGHQREHILDYLYRGVPASNQSKRAAGEYKGKEAMGRRPPHILLADSHPSCCSALKRHLEDVGYPVRCSTSGQDVILQCDIAPPDILIMDVHLPDMDGFEVCEYIRHETRDAELTTIIVTDVDDEMTRTYLGQMADYVGADYFLAKPCDGHLLVTLVDTLARQHGVPGQRRPQQATVGSV